MNVSYQEYVNRKLIVFRTKIKLSYAQKEFI